MGSRSNVQIMGGHFESHEQNWFQHLKSEIDLKYPSGELEYLHKSLNLTSYQVIQARSFKQNYF